MPRLLLAFVLGQSVFLAGLAAMAGKRSSPGRGGPDGGWEPEAPLRSGWTHIVVHHSAGASGSAAQFHEEHRRKGWDGLGYHFVIGNGSRTEDGRIETGYRWADQLDGAHAKREWNARAIGICLVGDFEKAPPSPAQLASLESLCAWLCRRCGIPPENVVGHGATEGNRTLCPGRLFDLPGLRARLK